jgi:hypothetical protein
VTVPRLRLGPAGETNRFPHVPPSTMAGGTFRFPPQSPSPAHEADEAP